MVVTAANVADVTQVDQLLHGEERLVCADAGYTGVEKRPEHEGRAVIWQIAARRNTYKKHGKRSTLYIALRKIENAFTTLPLKGLFRGAEAVTQKSGKLNGAGEYFDRNRKRVCGLCLVIELVIF